MALEFRTTTDCPFCGEPYTALWWRGQKITGIKHKRLELDAACRGTEVIDPTTHRHVLVSNYERLFEHLRNEAYIREQQRIAQGRSDFGL